MCLGTGWWCMRCWWPWTYYREEQTSWGLLHDSSRVQLCMVVTSAEMTRPVVFWKGSLNIYCRNTCLSSEISEMNHNNIWSHRLTDPNLNWGNGFLLLPEENKAVSASTSLVPSSNINFSLGSSSDLMNYRSFNTGVSCDPYLNYSSVRRSSLVSQIYPHSGSYHNQIDIRASTSAANGEADYERLYFKRKSSSYSMALDIMNSDEYYNVRNSNGFSTLFDQNMSNRNSGPHSWPQSSTSIFPGYPSNGLSTNGERSLSHRNVRSRHGHAFQLENNLVGPHASSSLPYHFHQTASSSGYSAMSFDSRKRFTSPGFFHHEINQPIGSHGASTIMEIADGYSSNPVTSRNTATAAPTLTGFSMQDDNNYDNRINPYSSLRHTTMEDTRQFDNEVLPHWRHHRLMSNGERHGRTRSLYDGLSYRMDALADLGHAHGRSSDEDAVMIDRPTFYGSPALFDQHRSLRMDVDNMSYEELIALGEIIGNVSTGLSEDDVAICLTRKIFAHERNQDAEQECCAICLEEYKDAQGIGGLNCGHDFHGICIKKWLLIKNACPICKSAALGDKMKGKQVLLM